MTDSQPSTTWPPASGCTTIVVPRDSCINAATYSIHIGAPAADVFSILRDTTTYPAWNTFVPSVDITSHPSSVAQQDSRILENGTAFTFNVVMDPNKPTGITPTKLAVTDVSTPAAPTEYVPKEVREADATFTSDLSKVYRVSWREGSGLMSHGIRVERFHEVIVTGERSCEVRTWENQMSVLAYAVRWMYGETIKARFRDWCEGLKKYSEQQQQQQAKGGKTETTTTAPVRT